MLDIENNEIVTNEKNELLKKQYTEDEIIELFFQKNKLAQFIGEFKKQKVFSFNIIKELTEDDLEKLGVVALGDRKRMVKLFSGNQLANFRNEFLYSDISDEEKRKLQIPENDILKQNKFKFKFGNSSSEEGTLTLYFNRIIWEGDINNFTIAIINIRDVSVKNSAGQSTLIVTDIYQVYNFSIINNSIAMGAVASLAGMSDVGAVGVAMINDKPITDIEYWRQKIESLREQIKRSPSDFGIPGEPPKLRAKTNGCLTAFFVCLGIFIFIICVFTCM